MRVEFRDESWNLLYEADMDVVPQHGDRIEFPSERVVRIDSDRARHFIIGERRDQHTVVLIVGESDV